MAFLDIYRALCKPTTRNYNRNCLLINIVICFGELLTLLYLINRNLRIWIFYSFLLIFKDSIYFLIYSQNFSLKFSFNFFSLSRRILTFSRDSFLDQIKELINWNHFCTIRIGKLKQIQMNIERFKRLLIWNHFLMI